MIKVTLKSPKGGDICDINLPESASELPLMRYVSFLNEAQKMALPGVNPVVAMAKAVAEFSGQELDVILTAQFGEDWKGNESSIDGIRSLYQWCIDVVGKYEGQARFSNNCHFEYKGEQFEIPIISVHSVAGNILPDIEAGEAIESFEVTRNFTASIEKAKTVRECVYALINDEGEKDQAIKRLRALIPDLNSIDLAELPEEKLIEIAAKHGDMDGSLIFSRYLYMMAILCRHPGEKLPWKENKRKAFLNDRAALFQEIDTQTALDVDFFLLTTLTALNKNRAIAGSLILQGLGATVETKSLSGKRTTGRSNTSRRFMKGSDGVR